MGLVSDYNYYKVYRTHTFINCKVITTKYNEIGIIIKIDLHLNTNFSYKH